MSTQFNGPFTVDGFDGTFRVHDNDGFRMCECEAKYDVDRSAYLNPEEAEARAKYICAALNATWHLLAIRALQGSGS